MFGYKYIVSTLLLLGSILCITPSFAEEFRTTSVIPNIKTYMWNDTLVVGLASSRNTALESSSKQYRIEYTRILSSTDETNRSNTLSTFNQYTQLDTYKIIGDTHYSILPRPQIGETYSFHVFLLGEDGITRIAYAIFDVKIPQYSLKKSGKITFTKAIRTNVIPHVMNRDFASALGFPLSWDLSANGIVRMSSLTQSSGAVLPLGTQFIINPLFHWINGPLSFAFQQEYQYANNWIVQKTANIVHDIVLSAAPVAQNNTTTLSSTPVSSSSTPTPVSSSSSSSSSSTPPPTNTGSTNTGSANTGSTNTGSVSTGSTNTGSTSTGSTSTGSTNTGSTSTGSSNTGSTTPPPPPTNYTLSVVPTGSGTLTSSPAGISCGTSGSTCSTLFSSGTIVTLTPVADSGSTFMGWNGACTGTGSCTVNMTSDRTVGATFSITSSHEGLSSWSDNFLYSAEVVSANMVTKTKTHSYKLSHQNNSIVPFPSHPGTTFSQLNVVNGTTYTGAFPQDKGTMELWVNGSFSGVGLQTIVDNYNISRNHIYFRTFYSTGNTNTAEVSLQKAGSGNFYVRNFYISDNTWNSVVITWDMTIPIPTASIYLNGVVQSTGTISNPSWRPDSPWLLMGAGFSGQIHDFRLIDTAINASTVESDYGLDYVSSGQIFSKEIAPVSLSKWQQLIVNANTPTNTQFSSSIEYLSGSSWELVPDIYLPGNASGFTTSPISLNLLPVNTFPKIRMKGSFLTTDSSISPELLDWKVTWNSEFTGHKRILLDPTRIAFIKSRIDTNVEPYKSQWLAVQARANTHILETPPLANSPFFSGANVEGQMTGLGDKVPYMAIAYLITEDPKYITGAIKWMDAFTTYNVWGATNDDLGAAHTLYGMALGYDWLYSKLSPVDRLKYEQTMINHLLFYREAIQGKNPAWWTKTYTQNHNLINMTSIATAATALYDHIDNADQYIKLAYDNFTRVLASLRTDGTSEEGISYWGYGMRSSLAYFEIEKNLFGVDRIVTSLNFQKGTLYRLYGALPKYYDIIKIADANADYYGGAGYLLRKFASVFSDPIAQWLAHTIESQKKIDSFPPEYEWRNLLWYDETIPEQDPISLGLPTYHFFDDINLFTSRSAWSDDNALLFTFKAGLPMGKTPGGDSGHAHPDEGQVSLDAYGKPLIIDDGYSYLKLTSNHNVATFDGSGQVGEGSSSFITNNTGSADIIYQDINEAAGYEYLIADLKDIYKPGLGVTKYIRHAIFLKKNTVVMLDEIETSLSHDIEWRLHLNQDSNFSLSGTNLFGTISGSTVGMNIDDISDEVYIPSITKENISASGSTGLLSTFKTNTYKLVNTGTGAHFDAVIRPFASGGTRSPVEFTRSGGVITIKLDDGSYTSISTALKQVQMNVVPSLTEMEVYSGASFSGQKTVYTSGVYINTGSFLFSSLRVPSQKIVRLCEMGSLYGAGNCRTLGEGSYSILPSELSKVEYLEIQDVSQYQKFLAQGTFDSDMDIKGPDGVIYPNFTFAGKKLPFPVSYNTTLDVTTYGADGTDILDDAAAINSALTYAATLTGQSVLVRIPAGTYYLDDTVNIGRSNITLQGDGEGITNIVPRFDGYTLSENPNVDTGSIKYAIDIAPASSATWHSLAYVLTGSVSRGTRILNFASGAHSMVCEVGRILNINAKTPQRIIDQLNSGEQTLLANDTWYNYGYTVQYARVIAANTSGGCNQVTLDRPIYEDLQESPTISIGTQGSMISEVGVEQLSIRQDNNVKGINAFRFFKSTESWMRNIHVERIGNWMYSIDRSIDFTVKDSTFENVLVYGGGGQGYGISTQNTNDGLFDNIIYKHMRHVIPHGSNMVYHRVSLEDVDFNLHSAFPRQILLDNSQIIAKTTTGSGHGQYGMGIWSVDTFSDTIHTPVGKRIIAFHNTIESAVESVFMGGGDTRNWVIAYNAFAGSKGAAISMRPGADNNIFYKNTFIQKNYQLTGWYTGYPYFPTPETATGAVVFLSNSIPPLHNQFSENLFFGIPDVTKMFVGTPYITSSSAVESNTFDINPNPVSVPDQVPFTNSGSLYEWQLINYPR